MIINTSKQIRPVGGAVLIRKSDHKVLAHRPHLPRIIRDGIFSSLLFLLFMAILLQSLFTLVRSHLMSLSLLSVRHNALCFIVKL